MTDLGTGILLVLVATGLILVAVVTIRSILRAPLSDTSRAIWIGIVIFAPLVGALAWWYTRSGQPRTTLR